MVFNLTSESAVQAVRAGGGRDGCLQELGGSLEEGVDGEDVAGKEWVSMAGCCVGNPTPGKKRNRPGLTSLGHSDP